MIDIQSQVFTRIKYGIPSSIKEKSEYKNLNFTTDKKTADNPAFPCVYIHYLGGSELGVDFESDNVNCILANIQIDIYDNEGHERISTLENCIVDIMKSIGFHSTMLPYPDDKSSVYRSIMRFRRAIGSEIDTL